MARWEQVILDKVQGFGGSLLHRTSAPLTWVFGLPQALEQLPQRAMHSALAIRQMMVGAQPPELGPCPTVRLAVHLGEGAHTPLLVTYVASILRATYTLAGRAAEALPLLEQAIEQAEGALARAGAPPAPRAS